MNPADLFMAAVKPTIVERVEIPARPERRVSPPPSYAAGKIGVWLRTMVSGQDTIWLHQAAALQALDAGDNVVLSTATASGKTLAFQAPIMREMLEGNGVCIVMYPQKALSSDQLARWRSALTAAKLDPALVGEINGDIAMQERERSLDKSRIILATADVIHSWLMRQVASPSVQRFLTKLRIVVIDEAHVLEGVFGSNSAFFFRRLRSAVQRIKAVKGKTEELQFIAATATIADPARHLELLTGCKFTVIDESQNGSAFRGLTLLHIEGPAHGAPAQKMLADTVAAVASEIAPHAAIAFADSRQGVEKIAKAIGREDVLPYRSGYEAADRRTIEAALRGNELRAVVSTSALELGIDIPQFVVGLNLGIPATRKQFRQRVGRIGRSTRGVSVVIAPAAAFKQLGSSLRDFYEGEVECSNLYLDNRFVQFQQARCLVAEAECDDGSFVFPENVDWPDGFADMFVAAQPGAVRPRDLDTIAQLGSDSPHIAYPLRRIGDVTYALRLNRGEASRLGQIDLEKALREAYPGATYLHLRKPYRVVEWRTKSYEHLILLEPMSSAAPTQPMWFTQVNVSLNRDALIEGRLLSGTGGAIAEIQMGVAESVVGYAYGSKKIPYREASKTNPRMCRKQREFSTTGIVLRINEPWFKGSGESQIGNRRAVADALQQMLSRERSISPSDIRSEHRGIAVLSTAGPSKIDDAIVIFDRAQGGLRLTAPLFDELPNYLERLVRGAEMAGTEALLSKTLVSRLLAWHKSLSGDLEGETLSSPAENDEIIVFAPESEVALRVRGQLLHRKLLEPQLLSFDDREELMYRYEARPGVFGWVAHDHVEAFGQNWRRMSWNPFSNEMKEIEL